jgi:hypothetical protein
MVLRKVDRLEVMLKEDNYDIFRSISNSGDGDDGTVLAEVRDLRRYLLLVEAEMMARGRPPVRSDDAIRAGTVVATQEQLARAAGKFSERRQCFDLGAGQICVGDRAVYTDPDTGQRASVFVRDVIQDGDAVISWVDNGSKTVKWRTLSSGGNTEHLDAQRERAADSGAETGSLAPWVVSRGYFVRKDIEDSLARLFWSRLGLSENYALEPHVESPRIPHVLQACYYLRGDHCVLNMARVPSAVREHFPVLQAELNMKEHDELPPWQRALYTWIEGESKFRLAAVNEAWGQRAES